LTISQAIPERAKFLDKPSDCQLLKEDCLRNY